MSEMSRELRHALRTLLRAPGFAIVVILTLGLGIGVNTALYSVVRAVLLAPLPYAQPERVAMVWSRWVDFPEKTWVGLEEFQNYQRSLKSFTELGLIDQNGVSITEGDEPERVMSLSVTPSLFKVVGVEPALGRGFTAEDATEGRENVVLLTHGLWRRRYGGDPNVLGRPLLVDGEPQTIIGVLPDGFKLPLDYQASEGTQLYFPLVTPAFSGTVPNSGGSHGYFAMGLLAPGATIRSANAELAALVSRLEKDGVYSKSFEFGAFAISAEDEIAGTLKTALMVLLGAVGFVLLIACVNVANLLLVRGEDRRREVSLRAALGADRTRLLRQFFLENVTIAMIGGAAGVVLAWIAITALLSVAPASLPRVAEARLDPGVLGFTALLSLFTALLFGLVPALQASKPDLQNALKEVGRGNTGSVRRSRVRQTMVISEVALAVVLVIGAGIMLRSFWNLIAVDAGFRTENVLTMRLSLPSVFYAGSDQVNAFYDQVLARVRALPGVQHAGLIRVLPIDSEIGDSGVQVEGYTNPTGGSYGPADWQAASDGFFEALGLELIQGRFFQASDRIDTEQVIIVNQAFEKKYFADGRALDKRVRFSFRDDSVAWQRVVGVVGDVRHNGLVAQGKPAFYRPHAQWAVSTGQAARNMSLVVKTSRDPYTVLPAITSELRRMDARLPIASIKTMDEVMAHALAQPRFTLMLLMVFGVLALTLAIIGVYGMVSYTVAQRKQEMGIRMALGAEPSAVVWLALRKALLQSLAGIGAGVALALVATRIMAGLVYQTNTADPLTYLVVTTVALGATLLASWLPARRAASADPLKALRE